jgi:nucleotide-binding universal stress UspA family protein
MAEQPGRILFPIDFSNRCMLAARHVKTWVDRFGAALDTLHVVDAKALGLRLDEVPNVLSRRTADLKHFCDYYFGGTVACQNVVSGVTAEMIEHFAKVKEADLIMLPRTHQGFGSRLLRDSLAATILERSASSVWITEDAQTRDTPSVNSILCAVHFERDLRLDFQNYRILQKVRSLANAFHAKVMFLNVVDRREKEQTRRTTETRSSSGIGPWLVQLREQFGDGAEFLRRKGNVVSTITDIAERVGADLVVVGRTRQGTVGLGVQSRILEIDHAARRPILSVW